MLKFINSIKIKKNKKMKKKKKNKKKIFAQHN